MFADWIEFVAGRGQELWLRTGEHVILTAVSILLACAAGAPLGIIASRLAWLRGPLLGAIGLLQTIPSLAMLAILLALMQRIGAVPAIAALTLYALLPIARNTLTGIERVPDETLEAARGIGMTGQQQLWIVQLPLAAPVMVAGIRTAAVIGVGIATLSAFIGAGGLGQFINRGLALSNTPLILLGAVPAALLALVVDFSIAATEWGLRPRRRSQRGAWWTVLRPVAVALPVLVVIVGVVAYFTGQPPLRSGSVDGSRDVIRIGTKNFTEQLVLGELMAQRIEAATNLAVERRFNLGGTNICHGAIIADEIDLYAEYSGTALTAILEKPIVRDPDEALRIVAEAYRREFDAVWLSPFGFNNTYTITVRKGDAKRNDWQEVSDLAEVAADLRAGFTSEFAERPDGYPGLRDAYGFQFGEVIDLDAALMYGALANEQVDVICAFSTDGRIQAFGLMPLEDDRGFFPPYQACPVVRAPVLRAYPQLKTVLAGLADVLDDDAMRRLNFEVDENRRSPAEVAREFLRRPGLNAPPPDAASDR